MARRPAQSDTSDVRLEEQTVESDKSREGGGGGRTDSRRREAQGSPHDLLKFTQDGHPSSYLRPHRWTGLVLQSVDFRPNLAPQPTKSIAVDRVSQAITDSPTTQLISLCFCLSLTLYRYLSLSISVRLSLCLSLSMRLSLSVSLSLRFLSSVLVLCSLFSLSVFCSRSISAFLALFHLFSLYFRCYRSRFSVLALCPLVSISFCCSRSLFSVHTLCCQFS